MDLCLLCNCAVHRSYYSHGCSLVSRSAIDVCFLVVMDGELSVPCHSMPCHAGQAWEKESRRLVSWILMCFFFFYLHISGAASRCRALCVPSISEDVSLGDEVEYHKM